MTASTWRSCSASIALAVLLASVSYGVHIRDVDDDASLPNRHSYPYTNYNDREYLPQSHIHQSDSRSPYRSDTAYDRHVFNQAVPNQAAAQRKPAKEVLCGVPNAIWTCLVALVVNLSLACKWIWKKRWSFLTLFSVLGMIAFLLFISIHTGQIAQHVSHRNCIEILNDMPHNHIVELHCRSAVKHSRTLYVSDSQTGRNLYMLHRTLMGRHFKVYAKEQDLYPDGSTDGYIGKLQMKWWTNYHTQLKLKSPYLNLSSVTIHINPTLLQSRLTVDGDDHHNYRMHHLWGVSNLYVRFRDGKIVWRYDGGAVSDDFKICLNQPPTESELEQRRRRFAYALACAGFWQSGQSSSSSSRG